MPTASPFRKAEAALRAIALQFPEAAEDHPWGHTAFKVKGKMFLVLGGTAEQLTVTAKLPSSGRLALALPFATPTGYGLGKSGWVTATFAPGEPIPLDRLGEWAEESYRAVAPKKLVAQYDGVPAEKPARRKKN